LNAEGLGWLHVRAFAVFVPAADDAGAHRLLGVPVHRGFGRAQMRFEGVRGAHRQVALGVLAAAPGAFVPARTHGDEIGQLRVRQQPVPVFPVAAVE